MRMIIRTILLAFFTMAFSQSIFAGVENGSVLMVKGVVTATSDAKISRTLVRGAQVFEGDVITTAPKSFLIVKMLDKTKLTLRPDTTIVLGKFNLDEGEEEACINLIKGGLRTVTGLIGKRKPQAFQLDTPIASIGIRGTDFITRICEGELCQLDQGEFLEEQLGEPDNKSTSDLINEALPEGAYAYCVTGAIVMTQCSDQQDTFELGKCRIRQKADCFQIELNADQAGHIGVKYEQPEGVPGALPVVPEMMSRDTYFKLSEVDDDGLKLIEFFSEDGSTEQQCTF